MATAAVAPAVAATPEMVLACFDVLRERLNHFAKSEAEVCDLHHHRPRFSDMPGSQGIFVTWNVHPKKRWDCSGQLRGCRGSFAHQPSLHASVPQYALIAALEDTRFNQIAVHEIEYLHCGVSLLHSFMERKDCWDWDVGTHGILIEFNDGGRQRNGTYLPEVIPEQGWDQEEALISLIRKAGFRGGDSRAADLLPDLKLTSYESSKTALNFDEYLLHRTTS